MGNAGDCIGYCTTAERFSSKPVMEVPMMSIGMDREAEQQLVLPILLLLIRQLSTWREYQSMIATR